MLNSKVWHGWGTWPSRVGVGCDGSRNIDGKIVEIKTTPATIMNSGRSKKYLPGKSEVRVGVQLSGIIKIDAVK